MSVQVNVTTEQSDPLATRGRGKPEGIFGVD